MSTETLRPNGVGNETSIDTQYPDSGAHWEKVDEATHDGNGTYVENKNGAVSWPPSIWQIDLYTLPDSTGSGDIGSVTVYIVSKHNVAGAKTVIRTHNTNYVGVLVGTSTYTLWSTTYTVNPYTGSAWTWAEIDALEIGVALSGTTARPDWSRCTQVYVVVTYATPAIPTTQIMIIG